MLVLDQEASLAAIPKMLPQDIELRRRGFAAIRDVLSAAGDISGETEIRLRRVAELFGVGEEALRAKEEVSGVHAKAS